MGTILEDKERRDLHVVAGLITLIKVHGVEWCKHAIDDLSGYVAANELAPCDPGYTRDSHGNCVKDPLPGDPTHQ